MLESLPPLYISLREGGRERKREEGGGRRGRKGERGRKKERGGRGGRREGQGGGRGEERVLVKLHTQAED